MQKQTNYQNKYKFNDSLAIQTNIIVDKNGNIKTYLEYWPQRRIREETERLFIQRLEEYK